MSQSFEDVVGPGEAYVAPPPPSAAQTGVAMFGGYGGSVQSYEPAPSPLVLGVGMFGGQGMNPYPPEPGPGPGPGPGGGGGGGGGGGPNPYDAYIAYLREMENARRAEQRRNAIAATRAAFLSIGLDDAFVNEITGEIENIVNEGYTDPTAISVMLRQTAPYKRRFAANDKRIKQGLSALSPAEYLQLERRYAQIMREAGLPGGFYDTIEDYRRFLENDVSPDELGNRVTLAQETVTMANPVVREQLLSYYNVDEQQLTAYFLDPDRARVVLQAQVNAARVGGFLRQAGFDVTAGAAEELSGGLTMGQDVLIDQGQLQQRAQQAALLRPLTRQVVGGEEGYVSEAELLQAQVGAQVGAGAQVALEQRRRTSEYRRGGGVATTQEGVVGLRRAAR